MFGQSVTIPLNASVSGGALPSHSTMHGGAEIAGSNPHVRVTL